jgi:hypothetical protein
VKPTAVQLVEGAAGMRLPLTEEDAARLLRNLKRDAFSEAARLALRSLKGPPHHDWDRACAAIALAITELA